MGRRQGTVDNLPRPRLTVQTHRKLPPDLIEDLVTAKLAVPGETGDRNNSFSTISSTWWDSSQHGKRRPHLIAGNILMAANCS